MALSSSKKSIIRNILIAVVLLVVISIWQTRHMLGNGDIAPELRGVVLGGERSFDLSEERGKTVLLYFFAPWCGVCKMSAGNLKYIRNTFGSDTSVIAVALDYERESDVENFINNNELGSIPTVFGSEAIRDAYKITAYPSYYIISKNGHVASANVGYSTLPGMFTRIWLN